MNGHVQGLLQVVSSRMSTHAPGVDCSRDAHRSQRSRSLHHRPHVMPPHRWLQAVFLSIGMLFDGGGTAKQKSSLRSTAFTFNPPSQVNPSSLLYIGVVQVAVQQGKGVPDVLKLLAPAAS